MSIAKKIEEAFRIEEADDDVEDTLMRDSILPLNKGDAGVEETFEDFPSSSLRRSVADCAYEGKPVSRKKFEERNWIQDEDSDELDDIDDTRASGDEEEPEGDESGEGSDVEDEESEEESEIDEEGEDEEESDSPEEGDDESEIEEKPELEKKVDTTGLNVFSQKIKDRGNDIDKGKAIKKQLGIWDNLIECRIKLQKGLNSCNRLFQKEDYSKFERSLNEEEKASVTQAYDSLTELIDTFASVQETMLMMCSDDKNLLGLKGSRKKRRSGGLLNGRDESPGGTEAKRRKSGEEYVEASKERGERLKAYRDGVVQQWSDKVRLSAGKTTGPARFAILQTSTLKQIESILCDRDRLVRRTQTNRSKHGVLGREQPVEEEEDEFDEDKKKEEVLDAEIFDDDDFYHKLLRDFIDSKTSDITDPTKLGRQWTKLQKLRSKMKKKANSGATKDRKIRYTVHPKMVNFMAPNDYCNWDDRVEADLFRSLFGRASNPLPAAEDKPKEVDELQRMEQQITDAVK